MEKREREEEKRIEEERVKEEKEEGREAEKKVEEEREREFRKREEEIIISELEKERELWKTSFSFLKEREKFEIEPELFNEIRRMLEEKEREIYIEAGREWLREQARKFPKKYPELSILTPEEIEKMSEGAIYEFLRDKREFWKEVEKDPQLQRLSIIKKAVEVEGRFLSPKLKVVLFKMAEGELKEKLWEKLFGKSLDEASEEKVSEEQGGVKKYGFVESKLKEFKEEKLEEFLGEELEDLEGEEKEEYIKARLNQIRQQMEKNLKMPLREEEVIALLYEGFSPEDLLSMKKTFFTKKIKVKTKKRKISKEGFEEIINRGKESFEEEVRKKREELEEEWEKLKAQKKEEILGETDRKLAPEIVELCIEEIKDKLLVEILTKEIEKDRRRKEWIEKEFEGEGIDIAQLLREAKKESQELKKDFEEDKDRIIELLKKVKILAEEEASQLFEKIPPKERERYERSLKEKKNLFVSFILWLVDFIVRVIEGKEIKTKIKESKE